MNEYAKLLGELDRMTKRMVFESYGVDMERCDCFIESSNYLLRCLKYRAPQMDEENVGLQSHTDLTLISVVHQLNNLNGLEIKLKDGEWTGVDASPSMFVVMAGDALNVSIINGPELPVIFSLQLVAICGHPHLGQPTTRVICDSL